MPSNSSSAPVSMYESIQAAIGRSLDSYGLPSEFLLSEDSKKYLAGMTRRATVAMIKAVIVFYLVIGILLLFGCIPALAMLRHYPFISPLTIGAAAIRPYVPRTMVAMGCLLLALFVIEEWNREPVLEDRDGYPVEPLSDVLVSSKK